MAVFTQVVWARLFGLANADSHLTGIGTVTWWRVKLLQIRLSGGGDGAMPGIRTAWPPCRPGFLESGTPVDNR